MKRNIVIMDFSGIYQEEQFYEGEQVSWIDLSDISGTNCYCDGDAQAQILERMEKYPVSGIYFIDSGNYHYMSRIGAGRVKEPFNLLVFDNHTDMQLPAFGGLLSCGGWIASALEEVEMLEARSHMAEKKGSEEELIRSLEIPANIPLYVSIDKDVLCPEEAATTWSQGDMTLEEMLKVLLALCSHFEKENGKILQVDICGECDPDKSMESPKNDHANKELLRFWKKWF